MKHLSSKEISRYLADVLAPELEQHAHLCEQCGARIRHLEWSLSHFRSSVRKLEENAHMTRMYSGNETMAGLTSLMIHAGVLAMLLLLGTSRTVQEVLKGSVTLIAPNLKPYEAAKRRGGGGGGGDRSPIEASKGKLPKPALRQFTPPRVDPRDSKLPMTPTIIASDVPTIESNNYGDPLSKLGTPSNGTGFASGIGSGNSGGVGPGTGPGYGPGSGVGFGNNVYQIGGGVSSPTIIHKIEPEYSEEARKAKWQGIVELSVIVDQTGHARDIRVTRALGLGLDQKAIEAVAKWLFAPGMKDGKPVAVFATIQVTFHLL